MLVLSGLCDHLVILGRGDGERCGQCDSLGVRSEEEAVDGSWVLRARTADGAVVVGALVGSRRGLSLVWDGERLLSAAKVLERLPPAQARAWLRDPRRT